MFISYKVKRFELASKSKKEAYLKGCKMLAKYVASNKYTNLSMKVEQKKDTDIFVFTLYTNIDLKDEQKKFCKICKSFHSSFFINEDYNCSRCNLKSFLRRLNEKAKISKSYYRSEINRRE